MTRLADPNVSISSAVFASMITAKRASSSLTRSRCPSESQPSNTPRRTSSPSSTALTGKSLLNISLKCASMSSSILSDPLRSSSVGSGNDLTDLVPHDLWYRLPDDRKLGRLEACATVRQYLVAIEIDAGVEDDRSADDLAPQPTRVSLTDDTRITDTRVSKQHRLHLVRIYLLATDADHIVEPPEEEVPVIRDFHEVAGVEAIAADTLVLGIVVVPVSHHEGGTAQDDHANTLRHGPPVLVQHPQLEVWIRGAETSVRAPVHGFEEADSHLGHAVGDVDLSLGEKALNLFQQRRRD